MKLYSSCIVVLVVTSTLYLGCLMIKPLSAAVIDTNLPEHLPQKVLILNSQDAGFPWATILNQSIIQSFNKDIINNEVQLHIEYSGLSHNHDLIYQEHLIDLYNLKYQHLSPSLIMATDVAMLEFIETHRHRFFPDVPVVYVANSEYKIKHENQNKMTGITSHIDITRNIESILNLHPDTRQIALISGADKAGKNFAAMAYEALAPFHDLLETIDLVGLSMEELLNKLERLPKNTTVLYMPIHVDGNGDHFIPREILPMLSQITNAPIYSLWDTAIGFGIVGGYVSDTQALGQQMASIGQKILAGSSPQVVQINQSPLAFHFDWQQLKRWNISPRELPKGSIIHNKPTTAWQLYKLQIIVISAIIVFLMVAIVILLFIKQHLRELIAERTRKLIRTNAELEDVNIQLSSMIAFERERHQEKMKFLDMLAHELRTPISTIRILLHGLSEVPNGVDIALNDMKLIIERCLQVGQLENQVLEPKKENCSLYKVLEKVMGTFYTNTERVKLTLSEGIPLINTDKYLLEVILQNLLDNALKYSPEGSQIEIIIETEKYDQKHGVSLSISNQMGVAGSPDPSKVFEKYYRNPKAYHRSGSGLGLSLIQGIAPMLGMSVKYVQPCSIKQDSKVIFLLWIPITMNTNIDHTC